MRTVWRYTVPVDDQIHELSLPMFPVSIDFGIGQSAQAFPPHGHLLLMAARETSQVELWVEVETDGAPAPVPARLTVTGTGQRTPEGATHVGSCLSPRGLVWHLWRVP